MISQQTTMDTIRVKEKKKGQNCIDGVLGECLVFV
jgi:hypothetical protein